MSGDRVYTEGYLAGQTHERQRLDAVYGMVLKERDDALVSLEKAERALAEMREALRWLRMALGWAVFREDSRVWTSNEMRDIEAKIDAALHPSEDTSDES